MRSLYRNMTASAIALLLLFSCAHKISAQTSAESPLYIMVGVSMNNDFSDRTSWVNFYNWEGYEFKVTAPDTYTLNNVEFHDTNGYNQSEVIISNQHGAFENIKTSLSLPAGGTFKEVDSSYQADLVMKSQAIVLNCPTGTYNVELIWNGQNGTLYLTKPQISTGIDTLEADNTDSEAIYYDITGRQVTTPKSGIYLCRKGNKVTKVVIR